jgi:hypothetical protein
LTNRPQDRIRNTPRPTRCSHPTRRRCDLRHDREAMIITSWHAAALKMRKSEGTGPSRCGIVQRHATIAKSRGDRCGRPSRHCWALARPPINRRPLLLLHCRKRGAPGFVAGRAIGQQGDHKDHLGPIRMAQASDEPASHAAVPSNELNERRDPLAVGVDLDNQVCVELTALQAR